MRTPRELSLVVPGLLDTFAGLDLGEAAAGLARLVSLRRLLSRSDVSPVPVTGFEESLCWLFGIPREADRDLPLAALTRLADSGAPAEGFWLRADPVHLRADPSRLILFDGAALSIDAAEAAALTASFNAFYAGQGWRLEAPHPQRGYLQLPGPAAIRTAPPSVVRAHHIDPFLPQGAEAPFWHRVMNEVQMLFHAHPVNRARETAGRPAINSLWFWGGGVCPAAPTVAWTRVQGDEPLGRGLAALCGVPFETGVEGAGALPGPPGEQLIIQDGLAEPVAYGDVEAWMRELARMDETWFVPLARALRRGEIAALSLYPCNGRRYRVSRNGLRRFWRRVQSWQTLAAYD
jgi:hypothetical protein